MNWIDYAVELKRKGDMTWEQIADEINLAYDMDKSGNAVRKRVKRYSADNDTEYFAEEFNNGKITRTGVFPFEKIKDATPESLMQLHGLDIGMWEVVAYRNNVWQGQKKSSGVVDLYQSRITVRPRKDAVSLEHIDKWFAKRNNPFEIRVPKFEYDISGSGEVLEICLPDIHFGLLGWRKEVGEDYDVGIARKRLEFALADIYTRAQKLNPSKIILVTLGDMLHIDNDKNETFKGTLQHADGRFTKIYDEALSCVINSVGMLATIAPVEYIYVPGNHDRQSGYALAKSVQMAYMFNDFLDIKFDIDPNPQKHRLIGCNLIGWVHGDMPKKNTGNWIYDRAKEEYGKAKHVEIHAGHFHTDSTKEIVQTEDGHGLKVRYLPTICSASYFEHQQGYPIGEKTVVSFVWNNNVGLREMWYSNV